MASRDPAPPPPVLDPPPPTGAEKLSPNAPSTAAGTPIVETANPTLDRRTGEPVSAEVRPQPVSRRGAFDELRAATLPDPTNAGTLPATTRVLASGHAVELGGEAPDTETRIFTAAIRILRGTTLYEAGASVPLTRREFESKRDAAAIVERHWHDGADV